MNESHWEGGSPRAEWLLRMWFAGVFCLACGLAYLVLCRSLPIDRAWFILTLLALIAALPAVRRITEVSAFGVTAKLREEVQKAEDAVQSLKALARVVAGEMLTDNAAGFYFFDPHTAADRAKTRHRVVALLKELQLSDDDILEIEGPSRVYWAFWLQDVIGQVALELVPKDKRKDFKEIYKAARDFEGRKPAKPERLKAILSSYNAINSEIEQWIESYASFLKGGDLVPPQELSQLSDQDD